ncbi:MAG: methyltransferase domain-containing protein [Phycisphaerae bacterium]|nr:methyltransferase domain-containing protein [Phycisphaerae bacterium]
MSPGGPHDAPLTPRRVTPPGAAGDSRNQGRPRAAGGPRGSGPPRGQGRPFGDRGPGRGPKPARGKPRRAEPPRDLDIVHEDEHLLVVDKPAGLLTSNMPGEKRPALFDMVKFYVRDQKRQRGTKAWIVHRLDKEASGLLVFAKSERAFRWLKEDFRSRRVHRLYLAVVQGEIGASEPAAPIGLAAGSTEPRPSRQKPGGTIQSFIQDEEFGAAGSVELGQLARAERFAPRHGPAVGPNEPKLAITHYRVLESGHGRSLLQLRLETGRKNQIRIHMKEFGHPIVGDPRYGATDDPLGRMALHAAELGFTHPATGQSLRLSSPAPAGFYKCVGVEPPKRPAPASPHPVVPAPIEPAPNEPRADDPRSATPPATDATPAAETSWDHVAAWYDALLHEDRSDHFANVILPGTLRLLNPVAGMRVLDVACGQGMLAKRLVGLGVSVTGIDASPRLIDAARARVPECRFEVADARDLSALNLGPHDAATCVMALMNIDTIEPVFRGLAAVLVPGGRFVAVVLHPAFRAPGQTSWAWDEPRTPRNSKGAPAGRAPKPRQFRRVDGYLSPGQSPIVMNPGRAAHGNEAVTTMTFHRPLQAYIKALADAGFVIEALEEWPSMRRSQPGPRAAEEDRARREIPLFLGLRAVKR